MTIDEAKKIMGKKGEVYSDEEVMEYIKSATILSDIFIDMWTKMTPEERIKYKKKRG